MKINRKGISRLVIELDKVVIKIPNFTNSWYHFLWGVCANIEEDANYHRIKKYQPEYEHLLCPVKWCSWGGWVLIMQKADVQRHIDEIYNSEDIGNMDPEEEVKLRYKKWIDAELGGDDKCSNYGYIEDRLVKIDYPDN